MTFAALSNFPEIAWNPVYFCRCHRGRNFPPLITFNPPLFIFILTNWKRTRSFQHQGGEQPASVAEIDWESCYLQDFRLNFGIRWSSSESRCPSWLRWCTWPGPEEELAFHTRLNWHLTHYGPQRLPTSFKPCYILHTYIFTHTHAWATCSTYLHRLQSFFELLSLWSVIGVTQKFLWRKINTVSSSYCHRKENRVSYREWNLRLVTYAQH